MALLLVFAQFVYSYPSLFWHFNSLSSPGPGLTLYNATISPSGTFVVNTNTQPYAAVDSKIVVGGDSTFVVRFFPTYTPAWSRIFDFGEPFGINNILLAMTGPQLLTAHVYSGSSFRMLACNGVYQQNSWNIVLVTVNQNNLTISGSNGVQCSVDGVTFPTTSRSSQYICKSNWNDPSWNGELDFVWYLSRPIDASEIPMLIVDSEMMGDGWTFQSTSTLDPRVSLFGSPDLSDGVMMLHGNASQGAMISPPDSISGAVTLAARIWLNSYINQASVLDISFNQDNSIVFNLGYVQVELQSMECNRSWPTNTWMEVVLTVSGTVSSIYQDSIIVCTNNNMQEPTRGVVRNLQYIGAGRSAAGEQQARGLDGALAWVMQWDRALSSLEIDYITASRIVRDPMAGTQFPGTSFEMGFRGDAQLLGGQVSFSGAEDVQLNSSVQISTPLTVSMLVYIRSCQPNCRLMDFANGPTTDNFAVVSQNSTLQLFVGGFVALTCANYFQIYEWIQLTVTHNSTTTVIYKNGLQVCSGYVGEVTAKTRTMQYLGKSTNASDGLFNGMMDYFMLFDKDLSALEVTALPNAWDHYFTMCPKFLSTDVRVGSGTCVENGRQGTNCTLSCKSPFVPANAQPGVCTTAIGQEQPQWSGQTIACVSPCPTLPEPVNGKKMCNGDPIENASCFFSCNTGLALAGNSQATCLPTGVWNSSVPTCSPICPTIEHAEVTCTAEVESGVNCTFTCAPGLFLSGAPFSICQVNATWSRPPACLLLQSPAVHQAGYALATGLSIGLGLPACGLILFLGRKKLRNKYRTTKHSSGGQTKSKSSNPCEAAIESTLERCQLILTDPKTSTQGKLFIKSVMAGIQDQKNKRAHSTQQLKTSSSTAQIEMTPIAIATDQALQKNEVKYFDYEDFDHVKFLSQGEGGSVELFRSKRTGHEVVIKVPHNSQELTSEASVWLALGLHPNVARILGIVYIKDRPHGMVMEYYSGGSLASQTHEFSSKELLRIAIGLARGLEHLHQHKIVHRDLAPRNVLLSENGRVVISDFGLSREVDKKSNSYEMTSDARLPWRVLAPECIVVEDGKRTFTEKTDVWGLGVTLWELATKKNAYEEEMDAYPMKTLKQKIATGECELNITPVIMDHPNIATAVVGCLQREPALRPSAAEICWLLQDNNTAEASDRKDYMATVQGLDYN